MRRVPEHAILDYSNVDRGGLHLLGARSATAWVLPAGNDSRCCVRFTGRGNIVCFHSCHFLQTEISSTSRRRCFDFSDGCFHDPRDPSSTQFGSWLPIDGHQIERVTRSQLTSILSDDSRFTKLKFNCGYRKCIVVSVDGTIQSENDLIELRKQIFEQCPNVSSRWLFWRLKVADTGVVHDDCDLTIFGKPETAVGNAG